MSMIETVAIATGISSFCGGLLGLGISWGLMRAGHNTLKDSHKDLKTNFVNHKDDRRIHIDPDRDSAAAQEFRDTIKSDLGSLKASVDKLDARCELRGVQCGDHFSNLDKKFVALTGKINGDES